MDKEMNNTLSVDADGEVLKCAKGADASACGYEAGAKICAKCGAIPTEMKMVPVDEEEAMDSAEDEMEEEMPAKSKKSMKKKAMSEMPEDEEEMDDEEDSEDVEASPEADAEEDMAEGESDDEEMPAEDEDGEDMDSEDEDSMDEEKSAYYMKYGFDKYVKRYGKKPWSPDMEDDEDEMEDEMSKKGMAEDEDMSDDETDMDEDEEMSEDEEAMKMAWDKARKKRIQSMGLKVSEMGSSGYVCAIDRKAYSGQTPVCDNCPGGCTAEKGLPGLLTAEGEAEMLLPNGTVIASGYSEKYDAFVVNMQMKAGYVNEVIVDGTTGQIHGFHRLEDYIDVKSASDDLRIINFFEAADIAVKAIDGHVVGVEADVFEGIDSFAVEIDGFDGKSYDVFVALDGEVLGFDRYELEDAEDIEAEAAEIALKRAFSEEKRQAMAKEGTAMSDGSYPIASEEDLKNAIQAFGRAKDKEATKRHIMKRAKDMGLEKLIPSNWVMGGDTEKKSSDVDAELMASLIEFELLQAETELN